MLSFQYIGNEKNIIFSFHVFKGNKDNEIN